ncbi:MAG TPA: amidohydrolase/deacetylase family metallohydrolase [Puia sp.]|uniref:amidohydrolase/deacetylase family metallohydrolase n=1 Tax=Puia sp. TaxID=2045100 RepID=UPI002C79442E|nr:amidohydrolase/deacetylase family metallohydrolase [Puia sp.]HVU94692.1 amidohydrolase/deacetylase family metallohydrolase [Puia sp.]
MRRVLFSLAIFLLLCLIGQGQSFDIVIHGGHVIDPKNNIDELMDVGIINGEISAVAKHIDTSEASQVVNATGLYVTPGLIDIHTHDFFGTEPEHYLSNGFYAVAPDGFTFRNGVTTVVDAGSAGWKTFATFKKNIIDHSLTRILVLLNIVGEGMRGGPYEQDPADMNGRLTAMVARANPEIVVGIKVAHFEGHGWTPVDQAVEGGKLANIPVMIDFGESRPPLSLEELFMQHLRPGDIFTHCFAQLRTRESVVDTASWQVKPFVWEARKKGICFDLGYGGISFAFSQAIPAIKQGFLPNSISTDLHTGSMNDAMKDMLNVMSKLMAIGMSLNSVILASTWNPAQEIKRPELGHLSVGARADVAILNLRRGKFGFFDYTGSKVEGDKKLEAEMTIQAGRIVYDLDGIASPIYAPFRPSMERSEHR